MSGVIGRMFLATPEYRRLRWPGSVATMDEATGREAALETSHVLAEEIDDTYAEYAPAPPASPPPPDDTAEAIVHDMAHVVSDYAGPAERDPSILLSPFFYEAIAPLLNRASYWVDAHPPQADAEG